MVEALAVVVVPTLPLFSIEMNLLTKGVHMTSATRMSSAAGDMSLLSVYLPKRDKHALRVLAATKDRTLSAEAAEALRAHLGAQPGGETVARSVP